MGPERRMPAAPGGRGRAGRGDAAVSPIIGTILVLAISVLGIVAVSNWGLPAIEAMQAGVQERSTLEQFRNLDATMQQLVSGTAGQTTFKWQPQISSGSVDVSENVERWFVAGDAQPSYFFNWVDLGSKSNEFNITSAGTSDTPQNMHLHVWQWTGGSKVELQAVAAQGSCTAWTGQILAGQTKPFWLVTNATSCAAVPKDDVVLSFQLDNEPAGGPVTVYAVGYLADVGRVDWLNNNGFAARHVMDSNGALLTGPIDQLVVQSLLGVPAPRDFTNSQGNPATSVFVRLVKLSGNASFSAVQGAVQHAVYLNLVGSYTMGSTDGMQTTSLYVWGDTRGGVYNALNSTADGYRYVWKNVNNEQYQWYSENARSMNLAVVYSLVSVEG